MSEDAAIYKNNIKAMMRIMASLRSASDSLIGKGANALMYQTGKDIGKSEGKKLDRTHDLGKALEMLMRAEEGVWQIELWKDAGAADFIFEEDGVKKAHAVFRECPIRQVCMTHGRACAGAAHRSRHHAGRHFPKTGYQSGCGRGCGRSAPWNARPSP